MKIKFPYIRCYHFNPDGSETSERCPYGAGCNYAHPGDQYWSTAKVSQHYKPSPGRKRRDSEDKYRRRPRSRSRSRDSGWPGRRRLSSPSRSPIRRRRHDSITSSVDSDRGRDRRSSFGSYNAPKRSRAESPAASRAPIASAGPSQPQPPPETPPLQPPPPASASSASRRPSLIDRIKLEPMDEPISVPTATVEETKAPPKVTTKNWKRRTTSVTADSMLPTPPSSSATNMTFMEMPPPPPPSAAALPPAPANPSPPPQPVLAPPPTPPAAREQDLERPNEGDHADPKFWNDKIEQICLAMTARLDFTHKEEEIAQQRHFVEASGFSTLDVADQDRMKQKLEKLELEHENAKNLAHTHVHALAEVNIWPTDMAERERGSIEDMKKTKEALQTLHELTLEFDALVKRQKEGLSASKPEDSMDVDEEAPAGAPGPSSRPAKRRRTEDVEGVAIVTSVDDEEVGKLREQFQTLEDKYVELEDHMESHDRDVFDDWLGRVDNLIDDRLSPLQAGLPSPGEVARTKESLETVEASLAELSPEVADLMLKNTAREQQLQAMQVELTESDSLIADLVKRLNTVENQRTADQQRISELEATFNNHIANPPPAPLPALPSQEAIAHLLGEPLADVVHAELRPMLEKFRQDIEIMLQERSKEMNNSVWENLTTTLRVLNTLSQRLGVTQP